MTDQQADDVIAERIRQLAEDIDFAIDVTEPKELRIARFVAAIKTSALLERVTRQPQEQGTSLLLADVSRVVEAFKRDEAQGYRSRDRQFAIELLGRHLAPSVSHQPVDAPIAPVVVNSQPQGNDDGNLYRFCDFVRSDGPQGARGCIRGAGHNGPHAFPQWEIVGPFAPILLRAASVSSQQEPPKQFPECGCSLRVGPSSGEREPSILPQSFFPRCGCTLSTDDGSRVYICPTHMLEMPAESQQEPPQEPVLRRDPCGCLHDGSRIVEWCTRSGQTHKGHEEEQRTKKI